MDGANFIAKPPRGWLHSDQLIAKEGITYSVRYIGCLQVHTSMRTLDFETRSQVAKECINRVCEAAKMKTHDRKRKVDKRVIKAIHDKPHLDNAGANVKLTVSSACLTLTSLETDLPLARHEMPRISFACGGDTDTLEFVAYVAKDPRDWRACYVLECGSGLAQEVITTIGQAFELRYRESILNLPLTEANLKALEYYNDLPGKVPPDVSPPPDPSRNQIDVKPPPVPPLPATHGASGAGAVAGAAAISVSVPPSAATSASSSASSTTGTVVAIRTNPVAVKNLIDLRTEFDTPDHPSHDYVNQPLLEGATSLLEPTPSLATASGHAYIPDNRDLLVREPWFHGCVSRKEAEAMLFRDGEFLVRESAGSPGQYVLTGMQGGIKKHLLLIDPEGTVRTKDKIFENVSHLINYHVNNEIPIISSDSALALRQPVHVRRSAT